MATERQILDAIGHLLVGYQSCKLEPANIRAYVEDLSDLHADSLLEAARRLRKTSKWMPSIAEIREAALPIQSDRAVEDGIQRQREEHERMVREYGGPPSPEAKARVNRLLDDLGRKLAMPGLRS
jgi:hypothetical protein